MTSSISDGLQGEFQLIRNLFAPLSRNCPGAYGLTDDVAVLEPPRGHDIVLKTDAIVEGVHFRKTDPPYTIAKKALRVNISDFAAKGAVPCAYLLALTLPQWIGLAWLERFVEGLAQDQATFEIALAGGDTDRTPGVLTIAVMMTGFVPRGTMIRRAGAKPGDIAFVTGTIGDAGGGLELLQTQSSLTDAWQTGLVSRYHVPRPRHSFGQALRGLASAALDVSDGLVADFEHIAETSGVRIEIEAVRVPLSLDLQQLRGSDTGAVVRAATSGDDYEIAFTAAPANRSAVENAASRTNTRVSQIGRVVEGRGAVLLDAQRRTIPLARKGYEHF